MLCFCGTDRQTQESDSSRKSRLVVRHGSSRHKGSGGNKRAAAAATTDSTQGNTPGNTQGNTQGNTLQTMDTSWSSLPQHYYNFMTSLSGGVTVFVLACLLLLRIQRVDSFKSLWKPPAGGPTIDNSWRIIERTAAFDSFFNQWLGESDSEVSDEGDEEVSTSEVTHFCFLLHGINGFSQDLTYVRKVMRRRASEVLAIEREAGLMEEESESNNSLQQQQQQQPQSDISAEQQSRIHHDMVVHACTCNERKTADGIEAGGERLVQEMIEVIRAKMKFKQTRQKHKKLTISILGNSLGGIYGRYAIAKLVERCINLPDGSCVMDDKFHMHMNIFCTTATPHLGVAGHTFFPLPRQAEIGLGHAMGKTGKDIFRITPLLAEMATSDAYLEPLGRFRKRIAFANAFRTDFPVPVHTAAFLSEYSDYPHHFEEHTVTCDNGNETSSFFLAAAHTPQRSSRPIQEYDSTEEYNEVVAMSNSLDALGWKKVFIDMRQQVPRLAIPTALLLKSSNNNSIRSLFCQARSDSNRSDETNTIMSDESECSDSGPLIIDPVTQLKQRRIVGSREVAAAMKAPVLENVIHWPIGHNMMVAFSRNRVSTFFNRGGRPIVDALAKELVDDIFAWRPPPTEDNEDTAAVEASK
jgi:Putative serine esterase (DUF676)